VLADADRLCDLRHLLDLVVDFRRADAHAARIERRVRAAMDDDAAMRGPLGEIAMAPDIVEALEIGAVIFGAVRIVPEFDRHGWEGAGADEFALLADNVPPFLVPDIDGHAERRSLDFTDPYRLGRNAEHEAGDDVRAAGNRGEMNVLLDALIDEGEAVGRQRRPRRRDQPDGGKVMRFDRPQAGFVDGV